MSRPLLIGFTSLVLFVVVGCGDSRNRRTVKREEAILLEAAIMTVALHPKIVFGESSQAERRTMLSDGLQEVLQSSPQRARIVAEVLTRFDNEELVILHDPETGAEEPLDSSRVYAITWHPRDSGDFLMTVACGNLFARSITTAPARDEAQRYAAALLGTYESSNEPLFFRSQEDAELWQMQTPPGDVSTRQWSDHLPPPITPDRSGSVVDYVAGHPARRTTLTPAGKVETTLITTDPFGIVTGLSLIEAARP